MTPRAFQASVLNGGLIVLSPYHFRYVTQVGGAAERPADR